MLLGVTDAAAAEAGIERILAEAGDAGATFTETEHAGVTIRSAEGAEAGAYALTDDQLVIGSDADAVATALDTHAAGTGTLAEVAEMTRLTERLPTDWLVFMTYDLTDLMAQALAQSAGASPEIAAALDSLLEQQSMRGAMAVSASGDRVLLDAATDPPTGPFAIENADRGLADEVPADTLYYSEASNLGATLAAVIEPIKQAVSTTPEGEEQIRTAEGAIGADLEELVRWIDDGAIAIGYDGSQPYGGMVLVPNDVAAAERRLGQLATFASLGALDPSSGVTVDEEEVGGVTVTTISWDDPNADPAMMLPAPTSLVRRVCRHRRSGPHRHRRRLRATGPGPRRGRFPRRGAALRRCDRRARRQRECRSRLARSGRHAARRSSPRWARHWMRPMPRLYETEIRPVAPAARPARERHAGRRRRPDPAGRAALRVIPEPLQPFPDGRGGGGGGGGRARAPAGRRRSSLTPGATVREIGTPRTSTRPRSSSSARKVRSPS